MGATERIDIDDQALESSESAMRTMRHIERYRVARRFCFGVVQDYGCGSGYGSVILARAPFVREVIATDLAEDDSGMQRSGIPYFADGKVRPCDTLVALEVIEHMDHPGNLGIECVDLGIRNVVVSFPDLPTRSYNPFHAHDLTRQDVCSVFSRYVPYHAQRIADSQLICFVAAPTAMPTAIFRNVLDLRG